MFKPGEIARVLMPEGHRVVTILHRFSWFVQAEPHCEVRWPVKTSAGVFDETDLLPAHPSVIATAEGRDLSMEAYREDMSARIEAMQASADKVPYELLDEVTNVLKHATLDLNGHWKNGANFFKEFKPLENLFFGPKSMTKQDAEDLVHAVKAKKSLDRWIPLSSTLSLSLRTCSYCGEEGFGAETNGLVVRLAGEPCKFPNGLPPTEWELNVPSGQLVVANDLRELFPLPEDEDFDVNTTMGCRQTALAYAVNGMSHAFVGNSCPGVYKCGDGVYKIVNPPRDEVWDGKNYVAVTPKPMFDGKHVAGICTDLWWYSICDHAEFKRRCKHFKQKVGDFNIKVVNVKPGVYRFRHDEEAGRHEGHEECIFTRFEWVREPDAVTDFLATYESADVNPNAYVQAQVARWPTLYGGKNEKTAWSGMTAEEQHGSWQRVADQTFCTIGGGVEWHEKGFPRAKVDSTIPDVEPPTFREQHHWYPFSKPYGGLFEPKVLTPSFAKLAFRILESVISFGTNVHDGDKHREVKDVRQRMLLAVTRYRELAKLYPNAADPEYVAWLGMGGRAEAWVKNFDLGPEFTEKHRKHAARQRWVPEDTYAVAFDSRKLKDGHFAWHPQNPGVSGCWASKENAQRYAIEGCESNFWSVHASRTSVPLYSVARVVKLCEVSHMGETLVEIAYDYGTPWMMDATKRKALVEMGEKAGICVLSKEEYDKLLPEAIAFFEEAEAEIVKKKKAAK